MLVPVALLLVAGLVPVVLLLGVLVLGMCRASAAPVVTMTSSSFTPCISAIPARSSSLPGAAP